MKSSEILKDYIDRGLQSGYTGAAITDVLKEALILMEMKEQDRLIELPVPIETEVWCIVCSYDGIPYIQSYNFQLDDIDYWGKAVFATREEAEARLKELRGKE